MVMRRRDQGPDPFEELGGHVVATALRAQHLLQPALELGVAVAGRALSQVPLDLDALHAHELPVEVELDLA